MERDKKRVTESKSPLQKGEAKRDIIYRVRMLYTAFILVGICITIRLIWVQVASPSVKENSEVLDIGIQREVIMPAHRGTILTRDGEPMALSSFRYHATIDFASEGLRECDSAIRSKNIDSLAQMLAAYFSPTDAADHGYKYITAREYRNLFLKHFAAGKDRSKKIFPRAVTLDEWNMIRAQFPILNDNIGIVCGMSRTDERIYPSGDLAHQFIGIVPDTSKADKSKYGSGIERIYDEYLSGSNGMAIEQRIAHGFWTRIDDPRNKKPEDGCNIVTTIDGGLQRLATEKLRSTLEAEHASFGVAMVMEVETGNILCMVNLGTGKVRGTNYSEQANYYALNTAMCPGSTFKLASAMALLEIGNCDINTVVEIPTAEQKVGLKNVRDSHRINNENGKPKVHITMKDGFAHSSNIYFASAIYERFKDDPSRFTKYLEEQLFNSHVGLQEFGETRSNLPQPGTPEWKRHGSNSLTLPQLAYGYVVEMPPIHTLTFFNGVANGGKMIAPRFVERVERNGEVVMRPPTVTLKERLCSKQTLEALYECLEAASADDRTSYRFRNLQFDFGCKTGTAQMWGSFVSLASEDVKSMRDGMVPSVDNYYLGSIVTMFPISKPKYTVMVRVAKQVTTTHPTYYGISLTGSTARTIMEYIYTNDLSLHATLEDIDEPYAAQSIKAGTSNAVKRAASEHAILADPKAATTEWSRASVAANGEVVLSEVVVEDGKVPNVLGMGLSDALFLLESQGLVVSHTGQGRIISQSLAPNSRIEHKGYMIHLTLEQ